MASPSCFIVQNRIGSDGRSRCAVELVATLNEIGVEPTLLVLHEPTGAGIGAPFGMTDLRCKTIVLARQLPRLGHNVEVILANLLARAAIQSTAPRLVINCNNTWAYLPNGPNYVHYVFYPYRAGLRDTPRYQTTFWRAYARALGTLPPAELPQCSTLIAISSFVQERLEAECGQRSIVIYPPSWDEKRGDCRVSRRRVVTIGAIHPDKRQLEQLEVARRLPDWSFTVIGYPASRAYLRTVERQQHELPNVRLALSASRPEILTQLGTASHFLHTARLEHFGIAAVEASGAGCIPVVPDSAGVREIVEPPELRFSTTDECVDILRGKALLQGCELLTRVQDRLFRFSAKRFRAQFEQILAPLIA